MIKKPKELTNQKHYYNILIAGYPGIGKSQLGMSAPKPLLLNLDKGIERVPARFRSDFSDVETYEELLQDLTAENLQDYETICIDTGGRLLELMKAWAIRKEPKNGQTDGNLTLKGYGVVGTEFMRFVNSIKYNLHKHCVVIFHAKEEKDGDNTKLRIDVEGQSKNNVWQPMDLGGFMEMQGNNRVISFMNCERFFGKGSFGVHGSIVIPDLANGGENNFLTLLIKKMDEYINKEAEVAEEERKKYQEVMDDIKPLIDNLTEKDFEKVQNQIISTKHYLTSEAELKSLFMKKIKELGFAWNKEEKKYVRESK